MTMVIIHGDGDNADDDDNGHDGGGDNADDDDEPPQTNLPPIIADSRDPGGEVRLKVWGAGVTQGWSSSSLSLLAPKVLLDDQWPMKTIHSTPLQSH